MKREMLEREDTARERKIWIKNHWFITTKEGLSKSIMHHSDGKKNGVESNIAMIEFTSYTKIILVQNCTYLPKSSKV